MSEKTKNYNFVTCNADSDPDLKFYDYLKINEENLNKIDDAILNRVVIGDTKPVALKNTFYLENKPMADSENLLYKNMNTYSNKLQNTEVDLYSLSEFTIGFRFDNNKAISGNFICGQGNNVSGFNITQKNIVTYENTKEPKLTPISLNTHENIMIISLKNGEMKFILNEVLVYSLSFLSLIKYQGYSFAFGGYSAYGGDSFDIYFKDCFIYNRALSQEEIKYNFHALGEDKVATIEDADGRVYNFSAKSQNVFMPNGSNLDAAMNQFISWKELTMNSDGTFPTAKCADWHSDKIHVEGQTVKNYAVQSKQYGTLRDFTLKGSWGNQYNFTSVDFASKSSYKIFIDVKEFTSDTSFDLYVRIPYFGDYKLGEISKAGKYKFLFSLGDYDPTKPNLAHLRCLRGGDGEILINYFVIVDENCVVNDFFTGLNSLGDKKDGRTYISLTSNGYENKIEVVEPLRKVGNVADVIDENVLTRNIGEESINSYVEKTTYNNNIHWILLKAGAIKLNSTGIKVISEKLQVVNSGYDSIENQGKLYINDDGSLRYMTNLTTSNISDVYPINIQYQLAMPTTEQVKSTFVYTPNQNGECSFKFNNAVAPSNSRIQVAQTAQQTSDRITALENALLLMQSK